MRLKNSLVLPALLAILSLAACEPSNNSSTPKQDVADSQSKQASAAENNQAQKVSVYHNATIYTVDETQPTSESFAVASGKFVAVGNHKLLMEKYPNATSFDLAGATVIPGFIDAHGHLLGLGQSLLNVDLVGTQSKQEIIERLQSKVGELADGQWLIGRGWDQNDWPEKTLPMKSDLDAAFPDRPVWLERIDGHAGWGNSAALAFADQDLSGDWQVDGGEIIRDNNNQATGVFIDRAANLVQSKVPAATDEELLHALKTAMRKTAEVGLTGMHDAGTDLQTWQLLQSLQDQDNLSVRVYAMANGGNKMLDHLCSNGTVIDDDAMLTARAIKLYSDGALGSRGAALIEDYSDDPGNRGLLIEPQEVLSEIALKAANCGLQVNIHAIGDRGNRITLEVLSHVVATDSNPGRNRIEHSQVIELSDFNRFKELQLIASVQPTHATSDMYWAEQRVGADRIKGAYAWQTFNDLGIPIALGSDFPVELPDPLHGFYAAITRKDHKGWPQQGWYASQKLSREQALYGFTLGAAYAAFQEQQLGSIEAGKFADFTVLSKDIMQVPEAEILETAVLATYINGDAVYQAVNE